MKLIKLLNISKIYHMPNQDIIGIDNISLNIKSYKMIVITGKSGSGKSTLLHLIGTLEKPSSGKLYLKNQNISDLKDKEISYFRNKNIGFIFQANNLLNEFNAIENVMMPALIAGINKKKTKEMAMELMSKLGLEKRISHKPYEMSGGEQQRVAIARSLIMSPSILLADEPTGNLDTNTSYKIQDLIFEICEFYKITSLIVTHDKDLANKFENEIIIEDGKIKSKRGNI